MPIAFISSLPIFLSGIRIQPLGFMEISKKIPKEDGIGENPYYKTQKNAV